ncbi:MAG: pyruvate dehydrogenase [Chloroflexi bacterium]|nr:MAG: pyruvate dehydrogenase [Chloroflexota bacterium]MBL1193573.1 pyruvate dehydrogenase [Chloroflexota bacterium]NOH10864.1 pyruvate dehydrogenase [Chloroflexota bacterium]
MAKTKASKKRSSKTNSKPAADWSQVARLLLTSRTIDEIEENELVQAGKVTYQFSAKGHELPQILLGQALDHPHDAATVYYRSRPFMLASGLTAQEAFAADMAKTGSPSEGRDVGVVYSMSRRDGALVLPSSGDVGAQYTPAAGWAQAITYYTNQLKDKAWNGAIAVALGGDGSVAANGFWAALTMATTLNLPMLFFIEDNGYGISVPKRYQTPGKNIAENLESFNNLYILEGSGTKPEEAFILVNQAVEYIRAGRGPCLLRVEVPRLTGHTFGEDQTAYKSGKQIKEELNRDPLKTLRDYLGDGFDWDTLADEVEKDVRAALETAEANPEPSPADAQKHLFFNGLAPEAPQIETAEIDFSTPAAQEGARVNFSEAVRTTIRVELKTNPKLMVFGEDVGPRGGVHRVTTDLQAEFGEARVFDTSLSEEGIMGRAVGLAIAGLRPLPEIQFRKYADPATEQINDTGWIRWRTAGKFAAPIVVRIPVGYSKKTGDPWHSVSGEAIYAHTLGWRVAYPSNAADAVGLLRTALREQDPTIFLEHRALYDTPQGRAPYPGDDYLLPYGQAAVTQEGSDLTVVSWGEMLHRCIEAAEPFGNAVEIIDLRTIIPWDKSTVLASVAKTGKCLVAHEDTRTGGFAGEIIASIADESFTNLDAPLRRVTTIDTPIPYNIPSMHAVIPSVEHIRNEMRNLLEW